MVPLSLIFLLELVEEKKEIPASVTELYDRFSDLALGRHDKEKGIEILFEYIIKKRFLASLAYNVLLLKERIELSREEFEDFIRTYATEFDWDDDYIRYFSKEIERTGILHIAETVMFKHRSFLDYFCAFYIHDQHDKIPSVQDFIIKISFDDNWGDSAFFSIGLRREFPESMIDKFFDFPKDDIAGRFTKLGVGRLLQAGWHSKAVTKKRCLTTGLSFLPKLREDLKEVKSPDGVKPPAFFIDLLLLGLAETGYASIFLFKDLNDILKKSLDNPSKDNLFSTLFILFALRDLLTVSEKNQLTDKYMKLIDSQASIEEQARALPFLSIIKKDDKPFLKKLRARADAIAKNHPAIMKQIAGSPT